MLQISVNICFGKRMNFWFRDVFISYYYNNIVGELARFHVGVTMEILRLDAWYSSKDGCLEGSASYIVRGLCRRCCLPELILRHLQVQWMSFVLFFPQVWAYL